MKILPLFVHIVKSPLTVAVVLFLIFQLQLFNVHIDFRDEGYLTYNALHILQGDIPYRDFFLTTTPGTFYLQALLVNLFGNYLIVARVFYIVIVLGMLSVISRLFTLQKVNRYFFLSSLGLLFISPAYAFYNIEGLFLFLVSLYLVKNVKKQHFSHLILLGITAGVLFLIKQSYGIANVAAVIFSLFFYLPKKSWIKHSLIYLGSFGTILLLYGLYLSINHAFYQSLYFIFSFSKEVKNHRAPFITTSVILIPLYFLAVQIMKKITTKQKLSIAAGFILLSIILYFFISPARIGRMITIIKDPLVYYYLTIFLIPLTVVSTFWQKRTQYAKELLTVASFTLFFFLASAASGRDYTTVLMVSPLFLPLCILLLQKYTFKKLSLVVVIFLLIYLSPFLFSTFINLKTLPENDTYITTVKELAGIKISHEKATEISLLTSYVTTKTKPHDKIICFPYCPLTFAITGRNSASYFSFFYPETFRQSDQMRVINDIKIEKPKMIILQNRGIIEREANYEDKRLLLLKKYFLTNYKLVNITRNFAFYIPKQ